MEEYEVMIYSSAQDDLSEYIEALAVSSPGEATRYLELLTERAKALKTAPESRPLAKDMQFRLRGYRTFSVNDSIVFYTVKEKTIRISRIIFERPQYEGLI